MKWSKPHKMLGFALGEGEMLIAEVRAEGGARRTVKHATFTFPAGVTLQQPAELGTALAGFLKAQGFAARAAIIGLPSNAVLCSAKALPPAEPAMLAGILQLQAEREFSGDAKDWIFDFVPRADSAAPVLLVAAPRKLVDELMQMAQAAKLDLVVITASPMALATSDPSDEKSQLTLCFAPGGASVSLRAAGQLCLFQHLTADVKPAGDPDERAAWGAAVADELRRIFVMHGVGSKLPAPTAAVVWDRAEIGNPALGDIGDRLGITLAAARTEAEGIGAALARVGLDEAPAVVDFAHSRLMPPHRARFGKVQAWGAFIASAAVIALGVMVWDWQSQKGVVASLSGQLGGMKDRVKLARAEVDRVHAARGWFDTRPPTLDCIRAITMAFPSDTPMWTTALTLRDNMSGSLTGKSGDEKAVLELMDRLKAGRRFAEVKLVYLRQGDRKGHEVAFAFNFVYVGGE